MRIGCIDSQVPAISPDKDSLNWWENENTLFYKARSWSFFSSKLKSLKGFILKEGINHLTLPSHTVIINVMAGCEVTQCQLNTYPPLTGSYKSALPS